MSAAPQQGAHMVGVEPVSYTHLVMEVMRRSGLADGLSRLLGPVLRRLFPGAARDREAMDSISANVSANLLGLGNAATPLGIEEMCIRERHSSTLPPGGSANRG